jgi:hypothetical protein
MEDGVIKVCVRKGDLVMQEADAKAVVQSPLKVLSLSTLSRENGTNWNFVACPEKG